MLKCGPKDSIDTPQTLIHNYAAPQFFLIQLLIYATYLVLVALVAFWDTYLLQVTSSCSLAPRHAVCYLLDAPIKGKDSHLVNCPEYYHEHNIYNCSSANNRTNEITCKILSNPLNASTFYCYEWTFNLTNAFTMAARELALHGLKYIAITWILLFVSKGANHTPCRAVCTIVIQGSLAVCATLLHIVLPLILHIKGLVDVDDKFYIVICSNWMLTLLAVVLPWHKFERVNKDGDLVDGQYNVTGNEVSLTDGCHNPSYYMYRERC